MNIKKKELKETVFKEKEIESRKKAQKRENNY